MLILRRAFSFSVVIPFLFFIIMVILIFEKLERIFTNKNRNRLEEGED